MNPTPAHLSATSTKRLSSAILTLAIWGLFATAVAAQSAPSHARMELIADETPSPPNARLRIGLLFHLDSGWHIYWQNAGDSGEPPKITWSLPDGLTATPLQFPAPARLPLGPLMDFGYQNEALFPFSFNVAQSAKPGPAALDANVSWLVCREVCIPGKAELGMRVQL